jgi:hypothetical protein
VQDKTRNPNPESCILCPVSVLRTAVNGFLGNFIYSRIELISREFAPLV